MDENSTPTPPKSNSFKRFLNRICGVLKRGFQAVRRFLAPIGRFYKKHSYSLLVTSLILVFGGSFGASLIQSAGNSIAVTSVTIPTEDGQYVAADLYRPKSATKDNKAPCIVVVPGFQRTKETQIGMALEMARRGLVVFNIDPYSQGESSSTNQSQSATKEGYGLIPLVEYIYQNDSLNYIDKSLIGAAGHSAGGNACLRAASYFGKQVIDGQVRQSKLHSIYVSGYVITLTDEVLNPIRSNIGIGYALYDEGAYRNENAGTGGWDGDMRTAPEALRLVNSGLKLNADPAIETVEIGRIYGNQHNASMRIVNNEKVIHALQPYDTKSLGNCLRFFDIAMDLDMTLAYSNQIWMYKEILSGVALVGGFLFIAAFGSLLLRTKLFRPIAAAPEALPAKSKRTSVLDTVLLWGTIAVGAIIACFTFIPMADLSKTMFPAASGGQLTWNFPERMNNAVMLWAVLNGLIGLAIFSVLYFFRCRPKGQKLDGLKIGLKPLLLTILCAIFIFLGFYGLDYIVYNLLHVDFRFFFLAARPLNAGLNSTKYIVVFLMYLPFFFIFYFSNSVRVNLSMRFEGQKEWVSYLIAGLANTVGLLGIMAIQYIAFAATKTVFWTEDWLFVNMLWSVIPMMFLLPIFNKYFFNRTGKVYLGPLVTSMIFVMMTMTNSVAYIPFF